MEENEDGIKGWFKKNAGVIGIVAVGLALGVAFLKKPGNTESQDAPVGDYSGVATDAYGRPIIYRDVASTFINVHETVEGSYNVVMPNPTQPVASAPSPPDTQSPQEHPVEEAASRISYGILGPNVSFEEAKRRLPGEELIAGKQGRIWVVRNGIQYLVTSGYGPGVTNDAFPANSPQNTPGAYGGTPIMRRW